MTGKKRKGKVLKVILGLLIALALFCGIAAAVGLQRSRSRRSGGYLPSEEVRTLTGDETIGSVRVFTLPLEEGLQLRRASYTASGQVILAVSEGSETAFCICGDDGSGIREIYRGSDNGGNRLLMFSDNRRVLLGDCILECPEGETLDSCKEGSAQMIPILFPEDFSRDKNVTDAWTEVIIAPDGEHFAWTIRRKDCGAVNAMGKLLRTEKGYEITEASYISSMNPFTESGEGELSYTPVIGGEVKQFVHGGRAISLVGSAACGMADSVIQDIADGTVTQITHNPGYDETTILSPDERLGITMTSRFSEATDPAVLGLVDRPYGQVLHNILGQIYMYCVTGVRSGRQGNVGPALIDLAASMNEPGYTGLDLSDPEEEWTFSSPLSWNDTGSRAMWLEEEKDGKRMRVQIAELTDYVPGPRVEAVETPEAGDYAVEPAESGEYSGKINGKVSGFAEIRKRNAFPGRSSVEISYHDYSDDGHLYYNGTESSAGSVLTKTSYQAELTVTDETGEKVGEMNADLRFSAAYKLSSFVTGSNTPELDTANSSAKAVWLGTEADSASMVK